jgi:hypothetical protein
MKTISLSRLGPILVVLSFTLRADVPQDITKPTDIAEYEWGGAAAAKDIQKGVAKYEIVGFPGPNAQEMKERPRKEYQIEIIFHGCIPGPQVFYQGVSTMTNGQFSAKAHFEPNQTNGPRRPLTSDL